MSSQLTCVVQASLQSRRLPRKVLMEVWRGKPMLQMVVEAALRSPACKDVLIQVPNEKAERKLVEWVEAFQFSPIVGKRVRLVSHGRKETPYDFSFMQASGEDFFRVTADCPLIDPAHFGLLLEYKNKWNNHCATHHDGVPDSVFPDGWDIEWFKFEALKNRDFRIDMVSPFRAVDCKPAVTPLLPLRASVNHLQDLLFVGFLAENCADPNDYAQVVWHWNQYCKEQGYT